VCELGVWGECEIGGIGNPTRGGDGELGGGGVGAGRVRARGEVPALFRGVDPVQRAGAGHARRARAQPVRGGDGAGAVLLLLRLRGESLLHPAHRRGLWEHAARAAALRGCHLLRRLRLPPHLVCHPFARIRCGSFYLDWIFWTHLVWNSSHIFPLFFFFFPDLMLYWIL
jgi:hypothetical protein